MQYKTVKYWIYQPFTITEEQTRRNVYTWCMWPNHNRTNNMLLCCGTGTTYSNTLKVLYPGLCCLVCTMAGRNKEAAGYYSLYQQAKLYTLSKTQPFILRFTFLLPVLGLVWANVIHCTQPMSNEVQTLQWIFYDKHIDDQQESCNIQECIFKPSNAKRNHLVEST